MEKRGRKTIGNTRMNGTQRNARWKLKKFGEKPKRSAMSDADRKQNRREIRKVKNLWNQIIRASKQLAASANTSLPVTMTVVRDIVFSAYTDDAILKIHVTSKPTDEFKPGVIYRLPHHHSQWPDAN